MGLAAHRASGLHRGWAVLILTAVVVALTIATAGPAAAAPSGAFGWGFNEFGQLGDGTTTPEESLVPVQACAAGPQAACPSGPFLSEVATVSAGAEFSVALLSNGTVMAWGENGSDQLGNGTTEAKSDVPVAVPGVSEVTAIAAGRNHTLALLRNGTVVAWGENSSGQLGNGTTTNSRTPVAVSGLSGVKAIAAGGAYGLALLNDGTVVAWGSNFSGELGIGTTTKTDVPVKVCAAGPQAACPTGPFLTEVTAIAAGEEVATALLKNGTVTDWGANFTGKLGNGTTTASDVPVAVSGLSGVVGLPNGGAGAALLSNGTVMDWGSNGSGQLGDGTTTGPETCGTGEACSRVPVMVTGLSGVTAIACGGEFRLAVSNGAGKAWGANFAGQLGNGTTTQSDVPVAVSGLSGITAVAAGRIFSLAAAASLAQLPTVAQVEPNLGSPGGGTMVTITGTNFTGATAVKFGATNAASFTVNSATSITAVAPAGTGLVNVTVTTAAGTSPTGPTYDYRPFVSQVVPRNGANAGGTSVEIIGTNFNEVEAVKFGSTSVSFTRNSETSMTAVSPPWAGGSARVRVSVTTRGGVSPERAATILGPEYFGYAPIVTSVGPNSGAPAGGTSVTIEGLAFESIRKADEFPPFVKAVKFGSTNATSFEVHPAGGEASVTAVAPAGTGTVDVTVETYAGTSPTSLADKFTYQAAPTVVTCKVEVTPTSARLCGTVNPNALEVSQCKFEYGETTAYGKTAACTPPPGSGTSPVEVHAEVAGLTPNTTYHFRISATNADGTGVSTDEAFKTTLAKPPTVLTAAASSIAQAAATLNASVNPEGHVVSECRFEWGTTTSYGSSAPCSSLPGSGTSPVAVSASITGLSNKTTYHFRISAATSEGQNKGLDRTFAAASAHVYKNGIVGAEGVKARTIGWGTLKLATASFGDIECHTISGGYMENPIGGGSAIGKLQAYFPYECVSPSCKAAGGTAIELTPENLPWSTEATEVEGGAFRLRTGNRIKAAEAVFLRVNCVGVKNTQFFAEDAPKILNNGISIGVAPTEEEFDPGSGELESEGGLKFAGKVKFEGYGLQELIEVKNP